MMMKKNEGTLVGEKEFYTVSLFDESSASIGELSKPLCDAIAFTAKNQHLALLETSSVRALRSLACVDGDIPSLPLTRCDLCGAHAKTCFQRPVELGYYCAECIEHKEILLTEFDSTVGGNQLKHLRCYLCNMLCSDVQGFDAHCQSRDHKIKREQCREAAASSHIASKIAQGHLLGLNSLRESLMTTLRKTEFRFRQHITKEDVEQLPQFRMNREWWACERRIMAKFSIGAAQSVRPCLDLVDDAATPSSPGEEALPEIVTDSENDKSYRVIHVSPTMSRADFQLMRKTLREETTFGFDTENAPETFFPRSISINPGPHLIQIATKKYVFLFSTTPLSYWKDLESSAPLVGTTNPATASNVVARDISEADIEAATAMMYGITTPSNGSIQGNTLPTCLAAQVIRSKQRSVPLDTVDAFGAFDGCKGNNLPMSMSPPTRRVIGKGQTTPERIPVKQRLPRFLLDFFCRQDTILVGFGLTHDIRQIRQLMKHRLRNLLENVDVQSCVPPKGAIAEGSHAELFQHYLNIFSKDVDASLDLLVSLVEPPTLDLSLMFQTDGMAPSRAPVATASHDAAVSRRTHGHHVTRANQIVGTTQAVARVFGKKFSKPKSLVISDWGRPSYLLPSRQIVYAARDVVVPLLVIQRLLEIGASHSTLEQSIEGSPSEIATSR